MNLCEGCGHISLPGLIEDRADQPEVERVGGKREYISGHDDFIYLFTILTRLNKKSEIVATCPLVLFAGESYMGTALCTPPFKIICFFIKLI